MRSWMYLFVLMAVLLVGCEDRLPEVSGGGAEGEICYKLSDYDADHGAEWSQTRGTPVAQASDISSMGVYAFQGTTAYINGVEADYDGFRTPQFWPGSDALSFYAYAPYASTANGVKVRMAKNNLLRLFYTVPQIVANQPDLMMATPLIDQTKADNPLEFQMQHVLAAVGFKVSGNYAYGEVVAIKARGMKTKGRVEMNASGTVKWDQMDGSGDFDLVVRNNVVVQGDAQMAINPDGYLMMIPQSLSGVELDVTVRDTVTNAEEMKTFRFEASAEWVAGQKYIYNVVLDSEIILNPEVRFIDEVPEAFDAHYVIHKLEIGADVNNWSLKVTGAGTGADAWLYVSRDKEPTQSGDDVANEITDSQINGLWAYKPDHNKSEVVGIDSDLQKKYVYLFLRENMTGQIRTATIELHTTDADPERYRSHVRTITQLPVQQLARANFGMESIEEEPQEVCFGFYANGTISYEITIESVKDALGFEATGILGWIQDLIAGYVKGQVEDDVNQETGGSGSTAEIEYTDDVSETVSTTNGWTNTFKQYEGGSKAISVREMINTYYSAGVWEGTPANLDEVSLANFAAMHVSLKNADLNDNGKIDEDEMKWYIPSKAELELISATDGGAYSLVNASYWSSTAINAEGETNAYARNVYTQKNCVLKLRDGMCRVRAVRRPD